MKISPTDEASRKFLILETTERTQTATLNLPPGSVTSERPNTHPQSDQTVLLLEGELMAEVDGERATIRRGESLIIPAGVPHRFCNESPALARAFTVYAPPAYPAE